MQGRVGGHCWQKTVWEKVRAGEGSGDSVSISFIDLEGLTVLRI